MRYIPSPKNENVNALMPQDAHKIASNMRFYAMIMAYSVNLLFGSFLLANNLGVWYYHFYALEIVNIVILSPFYDWLIWCSSAVVVIAETLVRIMQGRQDRLRMPRWVIIPYVLLIASFALFPFSSQIVAVISAPLGFVVVALSTYYGKGLLFTSRKEAVALVIACSGGLLVPIEVASLGSWIMNAFSYETPFGPGMRWVFPKLDLGIFSLLYPLTSWLLLIFLFCWLWVPLSRRLPVRWRGRKLMPAIGPPSDHALGWRSQAFVLLIAAALAGFVAYYPYIRLSPQYLVGVDGVHYYGFLSRMVNEGPFATIVPDRPLFMIMLYFIKSATLQPVEIIVRIMPVICAVLLVLAVFWLVKTGTKDIRQALLASIFTAFSFQITAGMMGYFLAAWFALAEILLFFTLLLKAMEKRPIFYSVLAGLASIMTLGTHPYSWLMMAAILVSYIGVTALVQRRISREVLISAVPLVVTASAIAPLLLYTGMGADGMASVIGVVNGLWLTMVTNLNLSKLTLLLQSLSHMADRWVGGAFGSPLVYLLAILGMATMTDLSKNFNRLLLCWVLVPSLAILALVPGSEQLYYRIAYVIPFQIPFAIGFHWLLRRLSSSLNNLAAASRPATPLYLKLSLIILFSLLALLLFNYALRIADEAMIQML